MTEHEEVIAPPPVIAPAKPLSILDFKVQAIIVSALAFILYFNSFFNEVAHDDGIVIVKNEYVQEGFAGIPKIFSRDAYDSYYRQLNTINQLSGGRYRPLSIVTFAVEQQFLGAVPQEKMDSVLKKNVAYGVHGPDEQKLIHDMHIRHIFNVMWYMACVVILLYFLRYIIFPDSPLMALIATVIFAVHPIHTEVVANVKSRDEIMSLMLICLTFIFAFRYQDDKKNKGMLWASLSCYFLAFLSKEYAITLVALLPLSLYLFRGYSVKKSIMAFLPYFLVIGAYMAVRFSVVEPPGDNADTEVLNNPYVYASVAEKLATEISTTLNYLKLLIFPHPLSADYSYNSIPYKDFSAISVWLSLIVHIGLLVAMVIFIVRRHVLGFAIAFYMFHLAMVCNIIFDIGATMGERLIFHSSVGFAIAVAYFLVRGAEKINPEPARLKVLAGLVGIIVLLSAFKTIPRNAAWKNDATLFEEDLKTQPNSVLVNANVAAAYITQADFETAEAARRQKLQKAITLLDHALEIHPKFVAAYLNRGIAWYKLDSIDRAKPNFDAVKQLYPTYPTLPAMYKLLGDFYMKKAWINYGKAGLYPEAIAELKKGIAVDSLNPELWYNLGGALYSNRQLPDAIDAWKTALKLKPDYTQAQRGLQAAMGALNGTPQGHSGKK